MGTTLPGEPPLDVDEIQGHVLIGFGGAPQALAAYTARDLAAAAKAVAGWAEQGLVTSTRKLLVRKGRRAKEVVVHSGPWVTVAVSHRLLKAAGLAAEFDDPWFKLPRGMASVTSLNDPPGPDGVGGSDWVVGRPDHPVDVLVVAAAGTVGAAAETIDLLHTLSGGGDWIEHEFREPLTPLKGGREHFGFRDGISQPAVLGTVDGEAFEGERLEVGGPFPYAAPGQELRWPGEFLFGYPAASQASAREKGHVVTAGDEPTQAVALNGSLLVYRRIAQDVAALRAFSAEHATATGSCLGRELTPEQLESLIVGRHRSGVPLSLDPGADPNDPKIANDFTFVDDDMARVCPPSAHIRKVNPRLGASDVDVVPRILRRGAPYGAEYADGEPAPPEGGRGLAFLAYQVSAVDQFGTLTRSWMNDASAPNGEGGHDLLVGQVEPGATRTLDLPKGAGGECPLEAGMQTWVRPTGGAFLFTPSLTTLRSLAG